MVLVIVGGRVESGEERDEVVQCVYIPMCVYVY